MIKRITLLMFAALSLSACNKSLDIARDDPAHINNKTKFSSSIFGVKGSPRVTTSRKVKKGGGRYQVGKPYKIRGRWYHPKEDPDYDRVGLASWYGPNFHGRLTANGEIYDQYALSAAHPTMPLPSYAEVTNLKNGHKITVRVNDRGPYSGNRIIDLSAKAAELLDFQRQGVTDVRVRYLRPADLKGSDDGKLLASFEKTTTPLNETLALAQGKQKAPAPSIVQERSENTGPAYGSVPFPVEATSFFPENKSSAQINARIEAAFATAKVE